MLINRGNAKIVAFIYCLNKLKCFLIELHFMRYFNLIRWSLDWNLKTDGAIENLYNEHVLNWSQTKVYVFFTFKKNPK